jgi:hypothetical protein
MAFSCHLSHDSSFPASTVYSPYYPNHHSPWRNTYTDAECDGGDVTNTRYQIANNASRFDIDLLAVTGEGKVYLDSKPKRVSYKRAILSLEEGAKPLVVSLVERRRSAGRSSNIMAPRVTDSDGDGIQHPAAAAGRNPIISIAPISI